MNSLSSLLPISNILIKIAITSKKRAFEEVGMLFEDLHNLDRNIITDSLFARERLGSTGLGYGIAIPHGRVKDIISPMAAIFTLQTPIGFDSPDELPVDLLFFLLIPETATQKHLEILSEIAELLNNQQLRKQLKAANTPESLWEIIGKWQPILTA